MAPSLTGKKITREPRPGGGSSALPGPSQRERADTRRRSVGSLSVQHRYQVGRWAHHGEGRGFPPTATRPQRALHARGRPPRPTTAAPAATPRGTVVSTRTSAVRQPHLDAPIARVRGLPLV